MYFRSSTLLSLIENYFALLGLYIKILHALASVAQLVGYHPTVRSLVRFPVADSIPSGEYGGGSQLMFLMMSVCLSLSHIYIYPPLSLKKIKIKNI